MAPNIIRFDLAAVLQYITRFGRFRKQKTIFAGILDKFFEPMVIIKTESRSRLNVLGNFLGPKPPTDATHVAYRLVPCDRYGEPTIKVEWDRHAEKRYRFDLFENPERDAQSFKEMNRQKRAANEFTLEECIQYECTPRSSEAGQSTNWNCPGCKQMANATKTMTLWRAPKILIIALKRFDFNDAGLLVKRENPVLFPLERLDLTQHFKDQNNEAVYDLHGVCYHQGTNPESGHYTSCVKSPGSVWHRFNDESCEKTNSQNIVDRDAYLLFYRRCDLLKYDEATILEESRLERSKVEERIAITVYENEIAPRLLLRV